jgi:hypothetical protein
MPGENRPAKDALALLSDERDRAVEILRQIEEEGWTHHEVRGPGGTIRDVTAKRANRQRQIIERMERIIATMDLDD